jgi:carbon monoxide dehydrogenase subunit G
MKIETEFSLPVPPGKAWRLLLDVPTIAPCVPGATLLENLGGNRYRGQAAVKLGPVQLQFTGEVAFVAVDDAQHTATVRARGTDRNGRGGAAADIRFQLTGTDTGSHVKVTTDLQLNGAIAQYGRAQGVIDAVAREIARQFADNLQRTLLSKGSFHGPEIQSEGGTASPAPASERPNSLSLFSLIAAVLMSFFRRRKA